VPIESLELPGVRPERSPLEAGLSGYQRRMKEEGLGEASLAALASDPVVSIQSLCYSGRGALERAAELRALIGARLASEDMDTARPLVQELLDLVPLALADAE
jgi:hypothetical protein